MKTYIVAKDEKTVFVAGTDKTFSFKKSKKTCNNCDLYNKCIETYTDDVLFPFPCTEDTRMDKTQGIFVDDDKIIEKRGCRLATFSAICFILAILVFLGLIPNFFESLINLLWD